MTLRPVTRVMGALVCFLVAMGGFGATGCTSKATVSPDKVILGFSAWPGWFPWQIAEAQGMFVQNGLNVELRYFDNYTESLAALTAGAIHANSQTLNDTLASVGSGSEQTIVLVNDNSTGNDKIIAREGIVSVADLKGRKVAVEHGTVDHYLLLLALEQAGLTEQDIDLQPMATDAAADAFVAGAVDAVGVFAPFTTTAFARPGSRAIASSVEFPGAIPDHLVVASSLVKDRPDDVQALVDTWFDALRWMRANKEAAVEIMAARAEVSAVDYQTYDAGTTIFTRQQNIDAFTPGTTPAHLNYQAARISDFMVNTGLIRQRPALDGLLDGRFVERVPE